MKKTIDDLLLDFRLEEMQVGWDAIPPCKLTIPLSERVSVKNNTCSANRVKKILLAVTSILMAAVMFLAFIKAGFWWFDVWFWPFFLALVVFSSLLIGKSIYRCIAVKIVWQIEAVISGGLTLISFLWSFISEYDAINGGKTTVGVLVDFNIGNDLVACVAEYIGVDSANSLVRINYVIFIFVQVVIFILNVKFERNFIQLKSNGIVKKNKTIFEGIVFIVYGLIIGIEGIVFFAILKAAFDDVAYLLVNIAIFLQAAMFILLGMILLNTKNE